MTSQRAELDSDRWGVEKQTSHMHSSSWGTSEEFHLYPPRYLLDQTPVPDFSFFPISYYLPNKLFALILVSCHLCSHLQQVSLLLNAPNPQHCPFLERRGRMQNPEAFPTSKERDQISAQGFPLPPHKQTRQCPGVAAPGPGSSVQGWSCFLPVWLGAHSGDMSRCLADVQPCSHHPTTTQCRDDAGTRKKENCSAVEMATGGTASVPLGGREAGCSCVSACSELELGTYRARNLGWSSGWVSLCHSAP